VDLFEQFGGAFPSPHPEVTRSLVDVFQVETRNPHFHEDKGDDHLASMRLESVRALLESRICPPPVRDEIEALLHGEGIDPSSLAPPTVYPPWEGADLEAFVDHVRKADTFRSIPRRRASGVVTEQPI
jgi:mannosyl-3-phosphoglycerate synthase